MHWELLESKRWYGVTAVWGGDGGVSLPLSLSVSVSVSAFGSDFPLLSFHRIFLFSILPLPPPLPPNCWVLLCRTRFTSDSAQNTHLGNIR